MTETSAARRKAIVLLDGGVGQELYRRSTRPAAPLWSVQVMMDELHLVEAVHLDFIEAGARIITVNTYTATPPRLAREGIADRFEALHDAALGAAEAARAKSDEEVRIAGCLPPLVGSYRPDLTPPEDECLAHYRRIVAVQADHVDLFLCETMLSAAEARAATMAAAESGKPVWTALSVNDADGTVLRSGEGVSAGAQAAVAAGANAVLINCSSPEAVATAMPLLAGIGVPSAATPTASSPSAPSSRAAPSTCWRHAMIWVPRLMRITPWAGSPRAPRSSAAAARSGPAISPRSASVSWPRGTNSRPRFKLGPRPPRR